MDTQLYLIYLKEPYTKEEVALLWGKLLNTSGVLQMRTSPSRMNCESHYKFN